MVNALIHNQYYCHVKAWNLCGSCKRLIWSKCKKYKKWKYFQFSVLFRYTVHNRAKHQQAGSLKRERRVQELFTFFSVQLHPDGICCCAPLSEWHVVIQQMPLSLSSLLCSVLFRAKYTVQPLCRTQSLKRNIATGQAFDLTDNQQSKQWRRTIEWKSEKAQHCATRPHVWPVSEFNTSQERLFSHYHLSPEL